MNSNVKDFLKRYIADPDPRYAVALRGKWGCGKTHFVDKWVEELKEAFVANPEHPDSITLEPVHVSLYGMKSVREVVEAIDRQVRPFMNSKWVKAGKGVLNILGKAVFKVDFDFDGKGATDDASLSMSLDSLSVLFSKDKELVNGAKILVFDDFERSSIEPKELMGFINSLVERAGCHVVIVGDFEKLNEESERLLKDFKEKTIGRTFTIHAETGNAINSFLESTTDWLNGKRGLILECFERADTHNLRLLRQSLRDFDGVIAELGEFDAASKFLEGFLLTFIAITAHYNDSRYHDILEKYSTSYSMALAGDLETRALIGDLQEKYRPMLHMYGHEILVPESIQKVIRYLDYGEPLKDFLSERMINESRQLTLFEKLPLYSVLEDEEFNDLYAELEQKILNGDIKDVYDVGRGVDLLCMFDTYDIHTPHEGIQGAVEGTISTILEGLSSADEVEELRRRFKNGLSGSLINHAMKQRLVTSTDLLVGNRLRVVPNRMQRILRNLDERNVMDLRTVDKQSTPDGQSAYEMSAVFEFESGDAIFEALRGLTNRARHVFNDFLAAHYHLGSTVINGDNRRFKPDMRCLSELKERVDGHIQTIPKGLSCFIYEQLQSTLDRILLLGGQPVATNP